MGNISTYLENAILEYVMRDGATFKTATVYCGLVDKNGTDEQMEAGTLTNEITEYTGNRKPITFSAPDQVDGKATIKNTNDLIFQNMPDEVGNKAIVKYAIVCDLATGGNILYWCPLNEEKSFTEGDTFMIPEENLVLDLD